MRRLGVSLTPQEVTDVFDKFDEDGDGRLEYKELYHKVKEHLQRGNGHHNRGMSLPRQEVPREQHHELSGVRIETSPDSTLAGLRAHLAGLDELLGDTPLSRHGNGSGYASTAEDHGTLRQRQKELDDEISALETTN